MIFKRKLILVSAVYFGAMPGWTGVLYAQGHKQPMPAPKPTPYCTIVAQSGKYDHHILETEGIYATGMEFSGFYSRACPEWRNVSWVVYSDSLRRHTTPQLFKKMESLINADTRVRIVVLLRFDGPKHVEIPPGTSPALAAAMRAINSGYGHMNEFRLRVVLLKIISVERVPPDTPWLTRDRRSGASNP